MFGVKGHEWIFYETLKHENQSYTTSVYVFHYCHKMNLSIFKSKYTHITEITVPDLLKLYVTNV
jgi:hypothetical protein